MSEHPDHETGECGGEDNCFDCRGIALSQARAELEAVKKERDLWYSQRNEATEGAQALKKRAEYLQAKLAAVECDLASVADLIATELRENGESRDLMKADIGRIKMGVQLLADTINNKKRVAESQAAGLRTALETIAEGGCAGDCDGGCISKAEVAIASLPAPVQARAELEKARDAVVEAAKGFRDHGSAKNGTHGTILFEALARLAALDSAQKRDHQFDYETGECTHGLIGNYSTCNGDPRGCCRRWGPEFQHCCYHLKKEWDSAQKGERR